MTKTFKLWDASTKKVYEVEAKKCGKEWLGICPGHDDTKPSLNINQEKGLFYCHVCGFRGHFYGPGYTKIRPVSIPPQKFLNPKLTEKFEREITPEQVEIFSKHFNIPISILRKHRIGMSQKGEFTFPIFTADGELTDIRHRTLKTESHSWKGSSTGLFGIENLCHHRIFLCEGESDSMTLEAHNFPAVGVPGVATFKDEWVRLFNGKEVIICFDNDGPGQKGAQNAGRKLLLVAQTVKILKLPRGYKDVRDFFNRKRA